MIEGALRTIAAHGLPGSRPVTARPPSTDDWRGLVASLETNKLIGLAFAAVIEGAMPVTDEQYEELRERQLAWLGRALQLEAKLLDLFGQFDRARIPAIVLKGPAFAHGIYPDPSWRPFVDIDLLVPGDRFQAASSLLVEANHRRRLPEPRPGFDERFGKAVVHYAPEGIEVDLHRTLVLGPYALWADPQPLHDEQSMFGLGGRALPCLSPEHMFIHACMHAVLGEERPRLMTVRDAAQACHDRELDIDRIERCVGAWRLQPVMIETARLVQDGLGTTPAPILSSFAGRHVSRRQARMLHSYTTVRRRAGANATAVLRAIPGLRRKLAYLAAMLFPSRDFVEQRSPGAGRAYWRRWRLGARYVRRRIRFRTGVGAGR